MAGETAQVPRLRPVEAVVVRAQGREMIALHDPLRYTEEVVLVSPEALYLLSRFDGTRDVRAVQEEFVRETGQLIPSSELEAMVAKLDSAHLLENESFWKHRQKLVSDYLAAPVRPAAIAGMSYPKDAPELSKTLDAYFLEAAKLPDDAARAGGAAAKIVLPSGVDVGQDEREARPVRAIVAPHIDPRRGGICTAKAFARLREHPADLYVIFGTAHGECDVPYALTRKNYETPLGAFETDTGLVNALAAAAGEGVLSFEFAHRAEHSIEFQVLFLQHALGGRKVKVLPVLCGSLHAAVVSGMPPDLADSRVARFHLALSALLAQERRNVCFIAGADLSHIGRRFGDPDVPSEKTLGECERHDRALLSAAAEADATAFDAIVREDRDRHRVCGYPPIYALLRAVPGARGRLLRYEQGVERETGSMVSFASMVLH